MRLRPGMVGVPPWCRTPASPIPAPSRESIKSAWACCRASSPRSPRFEVLNMHPDPFPVIPAKAGIHEHRRARVGGRLRSWTPAFAGVTKHLRLAAMALLCLVAPPASAARVKDLGNFTGTTTYQLVRSCIFAGLKVYGGENAKNKTTKQ